MSLPRWATRVTPLSKLIALILFVSLPFIGFYFGIQYQKDFPPAEVLTSVKPREKIIIYKVRDADTLISLAEKFDISENTIRWANNMRTNDLHPGTLLKILPVTGVSHTVVKGDTIYSLATKYHTSPESIVNFPFNKFKDLETFELFVGEVLYIPDGILD